MVTVTAALALTIEPRVMLDNVCDGIREQVERAGQAARSVPTDVEGVRALRRRLVTFERAVAQLDEARDHLDACARAAHAALDVVYEAAAPDARTWLMSRQARAIDALNSETHRLNTEQEN